MWPDGLIVIFRYGIFWGGLKPPLTIFYFQEINKPRKKKGMWPALVGSFKISREKKALTFVYFIMFIDCIIYKELKQRVWQGIALVFIKTWVRAPGPHPFHIIFHLTLICSFNAKAHHASTLSSRPRVPLHSIIPIQGPGSRDHDGY